MSNSKFFLLLSVSALILTAIMLIVIRHNLKEMNIRVRTIERRSEREKKCNRTIDSLIRRRDGILFNYQKPIVEHSEIK